MSAQSLLVLLSHDLLLPAAETLLLLRHTLTFGRLDLGLSDRVIMAGVLAGPWQGETVTCETREKVDV